MEVLIRRQTTTNHGIWVTNTQQAQCDIPYNRRLSKEFGGVDTHPDSGRGAG